MFWSLCKDVVLKGNDKNKYEIVNNVLGNQAKARKVIKEVGFDYVVIDTCFSDETVYYRERNRHLKKCTHINCKISQYHIDGQWFD